ncbi:hypothetical protein CC1G_00291 [Coprinopsis cinerea okayama7|uniref:Uncharacterized protein n=1 Tax=Coprinopsis cinerea (strain Okayama-7 / 130 / ATCC MYA-4618 / FGSC 9003) TaxID=240176 RepID=A8NXF8_COPC7|nr:hypothetical protein CC1G_00291 [Coprinopsis cinerea okayama7\|eukprot:XP_001837155.2 hypothetical protein CC1G_00291 [Coprinopsis cinerea okayama7\
MPAAFSRLQLAAALIEYDNDSEDPDAPRRSAQESAIFAHLRRNPAARPDLSARKSSNYLTATQNGRESIADTRRSRASRGSLDALRNPFGADGNSEYDDDGDEPPSEMEVDLSSWGLDAFIPKEKAERSKKGKEKQGSVPVRSRTISGGPQEVGEASNAVAHSRSASTLIMRRQSTSSRLDFPEDAGAGGTLHRRRAASQSSMLLQSPNGTVPFPSPRPMTPGTPGDGFAEVAEDIYPPRSHSRASFGSRNVLDDAGELRPRSMSQGTIGVDQQPQESDNPFALRAPTVTSRFDPKAAHVRTTSMASFGTRQLLDNEDAESIKSRNSFNQNRPYSVVELLRPKVLVMPSPLQSTGPDASQPNIVRDGFQLSRDGPPLPPGARTSRRLSTNLDAVPNPSNSFIPNPTADLSMAQKIFRDTLIGHAAATGPGGIPPRAQNDGEQIEFEPPEIDEEQMFFGANQGRPTRPAGKLYGKSLIDDLETRKAQMRSKQRVFTGDQRPTMMARESNRTSTLIDPASLSQKPGTQRQSSYGSQGGQSTGLERRGSSHMKPFLSFDEESKHHQEPQNPDRIPKNKSVFGVDTLWEQEMAKLRLIQEEERIEEEKRRKREEEEARLRAEKRRNKKKLRKKNAPPRDGMDDVPTPPEEDVPPVDLDVHVPAEPPTLPDVQPVTARKAQQVEEDDDDDEDEDTDEEGAPLPSRKEPSAAAWLSDSEDERPAGPVRTTGVGLRNPSQAKAANYRRGQSDSEEDLPLAAAKQRATRMMAESDDEDKPLARVIQESKSKSPMIDIDFDKPGVGQSQSDDEDSQPLGIRASRLMMANASNVDDDDKPLAFHPEQQRRTQYNLLAQQQHNQMMMQAQFQNSMFFNAPPMMTPPFFAPAMMNPMAMMQPPMPIPSPPPMHDENKFLSVDKWRRDVVVDGDQQ